MSPLRLLALIPALLLIGMSGYQPDRREGEAEFWDYGGDEPRSPNAGLTAEEWPKWAREAWPAACVALQVRKVTGRALKADRQCRVRATMGYEPVDLVEVKGALSTMDGNKFDVVWSWSQRGTRSDQDSCLSDPVDEDEHEYRLTRSRAAQMWRLANAPSDKFPRINPDEVGATCDELDKFLRERGAAQDSPSIGLLGSRIETRPMADPIEFRKHEDDVKDRPPASPSVQKRNVRNAP